MDTQQNQSMPKEEAPQKDVLMAVLAYIGPLVIISYIQAKNDLFVKFHIKQGLVLLVIEVAVWFWHFGLVPSGVSALLFTVILIKRKKFIFIPKYLLLPF